MSRRLGPFLFAGILGVVSGIYIFKPAFDHAAQRDKPIKQDVSSETSQQSSKHSETK